MRNNVEMYRGNIEMYMGNIETYEDILGNIEMHGKHSNVHKILQYMEIIELCTKY